VQFSEAMDPTTVNANTVLLLLSGGLAVPTTVSYNAATFTATLTPSSPLSTSTAYTVDVKGGTPGSAVADTFGDPMAADFTSTFTTAASNLTANAGPDQSSNEGSAVSFAGSASGGTGTLSYDWNWGDGTQDTTGTLTPTHTFGDNGTYTVTLTVTDGANHTASDTAIVTVANVPPTATLSNNGPVAAGATVTITFSNQYDPSPADMAAGFKYSYDFNNDGVWDVVDSTSASATTSFATAGTYTVKGRIKDKDGGYTDYTTTVQVTGTNGLVAYFPFNEGSGTTVQSTVGGLTGTISNATWVPGESGNALSFNGTNAWVTVPDSPALELTTAMTLEAWVKPTAAPPSGSWASVLFKEGATDANYTIYGFDGNRDPLLGFYTPSGVVQAIGPSTLALGTWTHLAATYGGSTATLYVNGTAVATQAASGPMPTSTDPLRIGGDSLFGEFFTGLIDEVRIYNRALSAAEIQADMNPAPTVTAVSPANGATAIATTANVSVTFNKAMDATTITTSSFQLQGPGGTTVPATISYNASNFTATLTPSAALAQNTTYTVVVHGGTGASAVKSSTGVPMVSDFTSTFTTTNGSLPTANAGPDQSGNEGSAINFTGSTTGGVAPFSYDWNWGDGSQDTTGTLTPNHAFPDNGTYTVTLTVTDAANDTASDTAIATVANVPPTASLTNNGPITPAATVTISFWNQYDPSPVDTAAGFKYSYDFNNDGIWDVVDSTSASATTSFATAGTYTVKGRIKDKDGGFNDYTTTVTVSNQNSGNTYYVATTGSDSANGSASTPWKTLQKAANSVAAGDTVIVAAGTYVGFAFDPNVNNSGTATNPITFIGNTGDFRTSNVIINAIPSVAGALSPVWLWNSGYIVVKGFNVTSNTQKGDIQIAGGSPGCQIISDHTYGAPYWGVKAGQGSDGLLIQNCLCEDSAGQHGIYVSGTNGYIIRSNICRNNNEDGIHTNVEDGGNLINTNGLIEDNYCYDNVLAGMDLTGMNNSVVRNNVCYGNGRHAIVLQNSNNNPTPACHDNLVVNNTFDATAGSSAYAIEIAGLSTQPTGSTWTSNCDNTTIFNNILLGSTSTGNGAIGLLGTQPPSFRSDYNIVVDEFTKGSSSETLAQWQSATGQDGHSFISTAAALFTNPSAGDYTLKSGSPAVDAGIAMFNRASAPPTDIVGTSRPQGAGIDIGAYELPV
jgi:PKD repeat protein